MATRREIKTPKRGLNASYQIICRPCRTNRTSLLLGTSATIARNIYVMNAGRNMVD